MPEHLRPFLQVVKKDISIKVSGPKRMARIAEAIQWSTGSEINLRYQTLWEGYGYTIKLGKPGKEAASDYVRCKYLDGHRGNNPNDMKPSIFHNDVVVERHVASFIEIFDEMQKLNDADPIAVEIVGCLLYRSAYMIDHVEVKPGIWRYQPAPEVIQALQRRLPVAEGVPIEAFLHFLDALAWNEDVKYHTLGYDVVRKGTGRKNNLLTCANLIGVLLNKVRISKFAGTFGRPPVGISPISNSEAFRVFPDLTPAVEPPKQKKVKSK
jgi:hypothetical protein